jgi:hypothetical protein
MKLTGMVGVVTFPPGAGMVSVPPPSMIPIKRIPLPTMLGDNEIAGTILAVVRACQLLGDEWRPMTFQQVEELIVQDDSLYKYLSFLCPTRNYQRLIDLGFAIEHERVGETIELTGVSLQIMASWCHNNFY